MTIEAFLLALVAAPLLLALLPNSKPEPKRARVRQDVRSNDARRTRRSVR